MKLFDIFKKQETIEIPDNLETGFVTNISHWDKHGQEIQKLHHELIKMDKLKDGMAWCNCQVLPEPTNKSDKNALKVLAYGKKWHDIGYIFKDDQKKVRKLMEYTKSNKYHFRVGFKFNQYNGVSLGLYFYEK